MGRVSPRFVTRWAIGAVALAVIAAVWIFAVLQIRHEREEAIRAAIRQNVNRTIAFEQYVRRTLEGAELATAYLSDRYAALLAAPPRRPDRVMPIAGFSAGRGLYAEINILNADGDLVATSVKPTPASINSRDVPLFRAIRADPSTALRVSAPMRSRLVGGWVVILSRRVNRPDGSMAGVVGVQLRPEALTGFAREASFLPTDLISVIGLDGITRARRTGDVESFGEDLRGGLVMRMQMRNPNGTYLGPSALDGGVRYFSHHRLPEYDLFVTSGVAEKTVLAPVRRRAATYIAAATLISLASLAVAYLLAQTLRRRAVREAEVVAANKRLREAQRLARLGDWSYDPAVEEFEWSAEMCALFERPAARSCVTMTEIGDLIGRPAMQAFRDIVRRMSESGKREEFEFMARLPSGAVSHHRIVAVPVFDASRQLVEVHGTDQDVTRVKLIESLTDQVAHLSRLDAMNAIASTVAHELNQPLTAAGNYASGGIRLLSSDQAIDRPLLIEALEAVRAQISFAGDIIQRVRRLAESRQAAAEPIALADVARDAIALVEAAEAGAEQIVRVALADDCPNVLADPVQLQQVLANLIRNAREASSERGAAIELGSRCEDGHVLVSVRDNGQGIDSGGKDIFSPFTTSKGEGLGLGLAICRTLVEAMGGRIWVSETGSQGTTICFTLPRAE